MIRKSIATTVVLCVVYSVVAYINLDVSVRPLNQRQGNLVRCQEYVFRDSAKADYVITGSSMAYRLRREFLPAGYYNLALGGHSSLIGLEFVNRSPNLPKVVFVEMNTTLRSPNTSFVDEIFQRPGYDMKKHVVITRDKFQFFPFLVNKANQFLAKKDDSENETKIDEATLQKRVDLQKKIFSKLPSKERSKECFDRLRDLVNALEEKNVRIVFFEMPMHPELQDSEFIKTIRARFAELFPMNKYQYIIPGSTEKFITTDGVHLVESSAKEMAEFLVTEFEKYSR